MKKQKAGKVIARGGFGCVFQPALKCTQFKTRKKNYISKLMTSKNADEEFDLIKQYKRVLKAIPNYTHFFLLHNMTLCTPGKLTKDDLENFDTKCKMLTKYNITQKNINRSSSLDKLKIITMPFGGIDVFKFVHSSSFTKSNSVQLNNALIQLLVDGILPMNELGVFHGDLKDANIVVHNLTPRIIDFGLSVFLPRRPVSKIPSNMYRRPFQFNVPFSSILFNTTLMTTYQTFLTEQEDERGIITRQQVREFVVHYIPEWNRERGDGHLKTIHRINKMFFQNKNDSIDCIIDYLTAILFTFTNKGELHLMTYFNDVFLKNVDIWGFVMTYLAIYEYYYDLATKNTPSLNALLDKMKHIIVDFLYHTPTKPIDTDALVAELQELNSLLLGIESVNLKRTTLVVAPKTKTTTKKTKTISTLLDSYSTKTRKRQRKR